ncbi:C40 family peptidase [Paenibacillus hamazuiensis]|uniref:C40 family peptidase n=1 Tax=Paenibacillus hamazuiensis TaxID=2936508 RepID=UPI00200C5849|nr:C40 family peptidase [Paenibacillus hamazuiensis]
MPKKTLAITMLCSALLLSSVLAPQTAETAHAETVYTTLKIGSSNSQVSNLQSNLKTLGYFTYPTITGYYGTITAQAVTDFQKAYSLSATGTTDAATQTAVAHALVKKSIVQDSTNYLKIPYRWGGSSPSTGFDCSGFVYYMFTSHGVSMSRTTSAELYGQGTAISQSRLQPGDLVFFAVSTPGTVDHVGIYLGNGQFISPLRSAGVYVQSMVNNSYWTPKYLGARRIY